MGDLHTFLEAAGWVTLLIAGLGGFFTLRQKVENLLEWRKEHQDVANAGMKQLQGLESGMSKGAEAGFKRVEDALAEMLKIQADTATHIARVSGQVDVVAKSVELLVSEGFKGGRRR